jgi:hypothetical protein
MRIVRELLAALRLSPEERRDQCAEQCLESLYDVQRASALADLGEHEEAAIDAQRRRWESHREPAPRA